MRLTVSGPDGTSSVQKNQLIGVYPPVVADFTCDESIGFAPLIVTCTDASLNADSWFWDFGDGTTSTDRNPTHVFDSDVDSVIELLASNPGSSATHAVPIEVGVLEVSADPMTGPAPLEVTFTADAKGLPVNLYAWSLDGQNLFGGSTLNPILAVSSLFTSLGIVAVIGVVASLYPASVALGIAPVQAMQRN